MALPADAKKIYVPLAEIVGKKSADGTYNLAPLDVKNLNDNMWNIVKKIQGGITLSDLTQLTIDALTANTVITENLYAEYGDIAELTVDRLLTANKVSRYLTSNTGVINYIWIQEQYIKFMTGTTDGSTVQHTNRNGDLLYWYTAEHLGMSTTETAYPVMVYDYDEYVKMELSFTLVGEDYEVDWVLGAGTGTGDYGKVRIHKDTTGVTFKYLNGSTGDERSMRLDDTGIHFVGDVDLDLEGARIWVQAEEPTEAEADDIWVDTDDYTRYDLTALTGVMTLSVDANEVITASGTFTITLHAATTAGIIKRVINMGTGIVTLAGTINGATNMYLYPGESVELITDGTGWRS